MKALNVRSAAGLAAMVMGAVFAVVVSARAANAVWTPKQGSDERKIVLNAARVPIEKDLGQPIVFEIKSLRVSDEWAFVYGKPKRESGGEVDWRKSIYADDVKDDSFSRLAAVLLARDGQGWRVITYSVGFSDVVWQSWDEEFGAPAWLWPPLN
ncbi:MAG: hypothetical protein NW216_13610 [Hyphomicrobium sp.]|nr:hypothetical protein [Hyphomicrobium sp.]